MRLVIDSNRIIASIIKDSICRQLIFNENLTLFTTRFVINEVIKYADYITQKSGLNIGEFKVLLGLLINNLTILEEDNLIIKMKEAIEIMKDIDLNDAPIIACALAVESDGIWSEDKHFERQNAVRIWKTKDILEHIDN